MSKGDKDSSEEEGEEEVMGKAEAEEGSQKGAKGKAQSNGSTSE